MALAGRSIVTGVHRFAVDRRRAGKPVSKRLSLSLRDPELETGSKAAVLASVLATKIERAPTSATPAAPPAASLP